MKETIRITGVLTAVCVICGFFLAFVFGTAKEKIAFNAKKRINDAIADLAPSAKTIDQIQVEDKVVYKLADRYGKLMGYAFLAEGQGYQGKIKMLAVIDAAKKKLQGIEIIESVETPGLGAKIQEGNFKNQFKKLTVTPYLEYTKDDITKDNQIKAITGATVSSKAVVNILNNRIKELWEKAK
jgi:electron transport complex protein RnfG